MATTKREIREFMRATREAYRQLEVALSDSRFDDAEQIAFAASGYAGEVEKLVEMYASEREG